MYQYESDKNAMLSIGSAFLIGGLIGAGIALLMAPQSGRKTRSLLMDKTNELKERAIGTAEQTKTRAEQALDDVADRTRGRVSELKESGQEMVQEQKEHLQRRVS